MLKTEGVNTVLKTCCVNLRSWCCGCLMALFFFRTRKTIEFNGKNVTFKGECMNQLITKQPPYVLNIKKWNGTEKGYIKQDN